VLEAVRDALRQNSELTSTKSPVTLTFTEPEQWREIQKEKNYILAYYPTSYCLHMHVPEGAAKLELPRKCDFDDSPGQWFLQYLVNVHTEKAFASDEGNHETVEQLEFWLNMLDHALQALFQDPTLTLQFHHQNYTFTLTSEQYTTCNFSELSEGQSRALSIFCDLLMRMECLKSDDTDFDLPGIVLIDSLENSLHAEIQKHILPFLVNFFPKCQFIISTHSPFIMNSIDSVVVFDLDRHSKVKDLPLYPYEALIERYDLRKYSDQIKQLLGEYENLLNKKIKTEEEEFRLLELGNYLAWVLNKFRQERQKVKSEL